MNLQTRGRAPRSCCIGREDGRGALCARTNVGASASRRFCAARGAFGSGFARAQTSHSPACETRGRTAPAAVVSGSAARGSARYERRGEGRAGTDDARRERTKKRASSERERRRRHGRTEPVRASYRHERGDEGDDLEQEEPEGRAAPAGLASGASFVLVSDHDAGGGGRGARKSAEDARCRGPRSRARRAAVSERPRNRGREYVSLRVNTRSFAFSHIGVAHIYSPGPRLRAVLSKQKKSSPSRPVTRTKTPLLPSVLAADARPPTTSLNSAQLGSKRLKLPCSPPSSSRTRALS